MTPLDKKAIAEQTAKMYLECGAVRFMQDKPFIFTSGWASPVYNDSRWLISFPQVRSAMMDFAVRTIERDIGHGKFDTVAGGETAGIAFAAWVAERMNLPMQYVRKKAKGFGRNAQIEGKLDPGQRVLLVEDLATDGRSKVNFVKAIRDAGGVCEHC
ncbi:MAG: orotate phosphoribosyltransferase, partial [Bradyrhizobium sp.]